MNSAEIVIVTAMDEQRGIGRDGQIPWRIPEDMKHFRDLTMGHPVVMGHGGWASIPAKFRPLPGRTNILLSRNPDKEVPGVVMAHSIEEAISSATKLDPERISIIGGSQVYEQTLPLATRLELTLVEGVYSCDAFFPDYGEVFQRVTSQTNWQTSNGNTFRFVTLRKGVE